MDRKKNRVADAVTMDLWALSTPKEKMPDFNGSCEICGAPIHIIMDCSMPKEPPVCDNTDCYDEYFKLIDKVLERHEETIELPVFEEELPIFEEEPLPVACSNELPVFDADPLPVDSSDELPVFENPWHKGFVEKEGEISKERYELVTQKMHNKYIGAYLILHPEEEIDEMEARINSHYVVWIDKKHNAFCKERGIKRKEGYSSHDIMAFHEFLYKPINEVLESC